VNFPGLECNFASLIYSAILLGCYLHLIRVPEQKQTRHNQKR